MIGVTVDQAVTNLPLLLVVDREGAGGVEGLFPTVALRDGSTTDSYLDFSDNTFKTSGWTTKYASMTEVGDGSYQRALDLTQLDVVEYDILIAEYAVNDGGDVVGTDSDLLILVDWSIIRKSITNRMEQTSGAPGVLVLFDDDGVTPLMTWDLRDEAGGGIVAISGASARRSKGTRNP